MKRAIRTGQQSEDARQRKVSPEASVERLAKAEHRTGFVDLRSELVGPKASGRRKSCSRRFEVVDEDSLPIERIMRRKRLILAAVRVWELKQGLRHHGVRSWVSQKAGRVGNGY